MYDSSLKYKWGNKNVLDYAKEEGIQEGIEKGKLEEAMEIALNLKENGILCWRHNQYYTVIYRRNQ